MMLYAPFAYFEEEDKEEQSMFSGIKSFARAAPSNTGTEGEFSSIFLTVMLEPIKIKLFFHSIH